MPAAIAAPLPIYLREISAHAGGLQVGWGEGGAARVFLSKDVGHQTLGLDCAGEDGALDVPAAALAALGPGPGPCKPCLSVCTLRDLININPSTLGRSV